MFWVAGRVKIEIINHHIVRVWSLQNKFQCVVKNECGVMPPGLEKALREVEVDSINFDASQLYVREKKAQLIDASATPNAEHE